MQTKITRALVGERAGRHMVSLLKTLIGLAVLAGLITGYASKIDEPPIDEPSIKIDRLCRLADKAFADKDFNSLFLALEEQFHVEKKKIRTTDQGIFIPIKNFSVEEDGYFLAKPGVTIILSTDPALVRVKDCIFRYHIKG